MAFYPDPYMMEDLIFALIPVLTSSIPTVLLGIASYVLTSMALYSMATRRGIGKAWLSWVPGLNVWIIGSLSDQYRYVVKGQYRSKRKLLLTLNLISLLLGAVIADVWSAAEIWKQGVSQPLRLGGAGAMDVIVISGIVAVLLAEFMGEVIERMTRGTHRDEDREFIDGEFVERSRQK